MPGYNHTRSVVNWGSDMGSGLLRGVGGGGSACGSRAAGARRPAAGWSPVAAMPATSTEPSDAEPLPDPDPGVGNQADPAGAGPRWSAGPVGRLRLDHPALGKRLWPILRVRTPGEKGPREHRAGWAQGARARDQRGHVLGAGDRGDHRQGDAAGDVLVEPGADLLGRAQQEGVFDQLPGGFGRCLGAVTWPPRLRPSGRSGRRSRASGRSWRRPAPSRRRKT